MLGTAFKKASGTNWFNRWPVIIVLLGAAGFLGLLMGVGGLGLAVPLAFLPLGLLFIGAVLVRPSYGLWFGLVFCFFTAGLTRYVAVPWGLLLDIVLLMAMVGWLVHQLRTRDWHLLHNGAITVITIWFAYVCLELFNPQSPGPVAWFYAMRGVGFYTIIGFVLTFTYLRHPKYVQRFLDVVYVISVLGAVWGLKQKFIGTDAAEDYWLYALGHHDEHVLHGVLRAFSFYSDAGQFGASQIMVTLMAGIQLLGPATQKRRLFYLVVIVATGLGFLYSGARGALAVPVAGGVVYMFLSKNFKVLIAGLLLMGVTYGGLKYTYIGQGFQPIARIRTALSADNPSLQARLNNQRTLGKYLASRPFGGGIGSAGYWGERFAPGTLLAQTPTDSYYVRVWVETGLVGLSLHLFVLGFFLGRGGVIVWRLKHPKLRAQILAILAAYAGVLLANYGNQVFLQFPTGIIMAVGLPIIFLAPYYEQQLLESNSPDNPENTSKTSQT
ncbi:MAG: O-antigen ligase family protein [Bacteroidota bacterium]